MPSFLTIVGDILAFTIVALGVVVFSSRAELSQALRRRLGEQAKPTAATTNRPTLVRAKGPRNPVLAWVQKTTLQDPKEASSLRRDLALAGFESQSAPAIFVICRFTLAAALPILFILGQTTMKQPTTGTHLIIGSLFLAAVGLLVPRTIVDNRANARKTKLEQEFPDALDLMVVCVESGLGLEAALLKVGSETRKSHPRVSEEFELVSQELRVGRARVDALRNMAERTKVDVVNSFVTLLIQTDSLGGSIATALRTYSEEMRQHRMLKAEEKAMRLPVLLTVPLVLCILPVIFTAVLLPAIIQAIRNFAPAMSGKG